MNALIDRVTFGESRRHPNHVDWRRVSGLGIRGILCKLRKNLSPKVRLGIVKDLLRLSAIEQANLIRTRKVSSLELVQAHIEQISKVNPQINAAVEIFTDNALVEARSGDEKGGQRLGHGSFTRCSVQDQRFDRSAG